MLFLVPPHQCPNPMHKILIEVQANRVAPSVSYNIKFHLVFLGGHHWTRGLQQALFTFKGAPQCQRICQVVECWKTMSKPLSSSKWNTHGWF